MRGPSAHREYHLTLDVPSLELSLGITDILELEHGSNVRVNPPLVDQPTYGS